MQDCEARQQDGLRERKKRATRRALHDVALRLVSERGLEHVTVEEISAAAGVSPRTFFNYFANKDQAVLGNLVQVDPDQTRTVIKSAATVLDGLRELCLIIAENTSPEREQVQMRWELLERYPALLPQMFGRFVEFEKSVASAVADRTGGREDDAYPQLMASLAGTSMRVAVRRWTVGHGDHPLEYHVNEVFGLLRTELPTGSGRPTKGETN